MRDGGCVPIIDRDERGPCVPREEIWHQDSAAAVTELRKRLNNDWLNRLAAAALREAIGRHGPITPTMIPSASKRIAGAIRGALYDIVGRDVAALVGLKDG